MAKKTKKKTKQKTPSEKPRQKLPENPVLTELLNQIAGEHGYEVAKVISEKEMTDDEVAKIMGLRINLVRRILYDLYDNRVVNYRRIRDENSGWYVYYWRLEPERALEYVTTNRRLLLQKLEEQLERERGNMYFTCNNGCPKTPFELATENDFKCPKCGEKLEAYDNSNVVTSIEHKVQSLRQVLIGG